MRTRRERSSVRRVLVEAGEPDFQRSEAAFGRIQASYDARPEYGYDPISLFRRASQRALRILELEGMDGAGLRGLDLGAGDGMLGVLLQAFGHKMVLSDREDWRTSAAEALPIVIADCCDRLPLTDHSMDFVVSFNAFEHFEDPAAAFNEALRVLVPGGLIFLSFNPLYCSPWGLHAYRMLRMPYPQFLFSEPFIESKLADTGIQDLGRSMAELQTLNRWRPDQFERLWTRPDLDVLFREWHVDENHLEVVLAYPECFRGRGLTIDDLVYGGIDIALRKRQRPAP
jgi:SAM-dependent methyltransferase